PDVTMELVRDLANSWSAWAGSSVPSAMHARTVATFRMIDSSAEPNPNARTLGCAPQGGPVRTRAAAGQAPAAGHPPLSEEAGGRRGGRRRPGDTPCALPPGDGPRPGRWSRAEYGTPRRRR